MNLWAILWSWRHIWRYNHVLAFKKSKYWNKNLVNFMLSDVIFDVTITSQLSISQNIRILTPQSVSHPNKTHPYAFLYALLGWKYVSIQMFSSIRSFIGTLTSFEWYFALFYDTWRHNIVLPPSKSQNV